MIPSQLSFRQATSSPISLEKMDKPELRKGAQQGRVLVMALAAALMLGATACAQSTFKDPGGNFTIAVPAGWHTETRPGSPQVFLRKGQGHVDVSTTVMPSRDGSTPSPKYILDYYVKQTTQDCTHPQFKAQDANDKLGGLPALLSIFTCQDSQVGPSIKLFEVATTNGKIVVFIQESVTSEFNAAIPALNTITKSLRLTGDLAAANSAPQTQQASTARYRHSSQPSVSESGNVYSDPQGMFSLAVPEGWKATPEGNNGDKGVMVAQSSTGYTMALFGPYNGASQPSDIVTDYENQFGNQLRNFTVGRHGDMNFNGYAASSAVCTGTNSDGVPLTIVIIGVAGPNGHFFRLISRVPQDDARAQNPVFYALMQSIHFGADASSSAPSSPYGSASASDPAETPSPNTRQAAASVQGWVTYQDPAEKAFTVQVPKGWRVSGGVVRVGYSDRRFMMDLTSWDGEINIRIGDIVIPPFFVPDQSHREGEIYPLGAQAQPRVARYRSGEQFAELYGKARFARLCDRLMPEQSAGDPPQQPKELFEQKIMQVQQQPGAGAFQASTGQATFSCASALGPRTAVAYAQTHMVGSAIWIAGADSYLAPANEMALAQKILDRVENSIQFSPQWSQMDRQLDAEGLQYQRMRQQQRWAVFNAQVAQAQQKMQNMQSQLDTFNRGWAREQKQFQAFDNVINGVTPTVDEFGTERMVDTGPKYNYYYNPGTGEKLNSNTLPGPGWQQLTPIPQN
ncbi:MAG: hypothetical protein WBE13_13255 [Candidatus Acidiferrum sp.]